MRFAAIVAGTAVASALVGGILTTCGCGGGPSGAVGVSSLKRLSKADAVWIDEQRREIVVGGSVVLDGGPIELFACPKGSKEHEAIVAVDAKAQVVHAGLLALGLEPGRPASFQPEYVAASGPVVKIRMRWKDRDGTPRETPAQEWIRDTRSGKPLATDWVFTGSSFRKNPTTGEEIYEADEGDLVCVSNFPAATIDLPIISSQSNASLLFEVMEGTVPPRGTAVEMVLSAEGG